MAIKVNQKDVKENSFLLLYVVVIKLKDDLNDHL